jgi:TIR domain-containing protein
VILSPVSVSSDNVRDEISFALSTQKRLIPVLYRDCDMPFRLARLQGVDLRTDYARGLKLLLKALGVGQPPQPTTPIPREVPKETRPPVPDVVELRLPAEQERLEQERQVAAEHARLEEEFKQARMEQERRAAEGRSRQAELEGQRVASEQQSQRMGGEFSRKGVASGSGLVSNSPSWAKVAAAILGILILALVFYWLWSRRHSSEQAGARRNSSSKRPTFS